MDKYYLKEQIIEGLEAVKPFSGTLKITHKKNTLLHILEEVEMELEHVVSCIVALKCELEREYR